MKTPIRTLLIIGFMAVCSSSMITSCQSSVSHSDNGKTKHDSLSVDTSNIKRDTSSLSANDTSMETFELEQYSYSFPLKKNKIQKLDSAVFNVHAQISVPKNFCFLPKGGLVRCESFITTVGNQADNGTVIPMTYSYTIRTTYACKGGKIVVVKVERKDFAFCPRRIVTPDILRHLDTSARGPVTLFSGSMSDNRFKSTDILHHSILETSGFESANPNKLLCNGSYHSVIIKEQITSPTFLGPIVRGCVITTYWCNGMNLYHTSTKVNDITKCF